jgi:hypothetical protein
MSKYGDLKQVLEDRLALQASFKKAFEGEDGERVLRYLMKQAGLVPNRRQVIITDPNLLLVKQGQQQIVLSILRIIGLNADQITEQIKESLTNEEL